MGVGRVLFLSMHELSSAVIDAVAVDTVGFADLHHTLGAVDSDAVLHATHGVGIPDTHFEHNHFAWVLERHGHGVGGLLIVVEEQFGGGAEDFERVVTLRAQRA